MRFLGKRVVIIGKGISGQSAYSLLTSLGANCFFYEKNEDMTGKIDLAVVSPGVATDSTECKELRKRKVPIIGELELGYLVCKMPIIAITGTNGKTTITELIGSILAYDKHKPLVCGNIGTAFSSVVMRSDYDVVVLEVSSFQLETIKKFRPVLAIISNITEDHLDRHKTMQNYIKTKFKIAKNQAENEHLIIPIELQSIINDTQILKTIKTNISYVSTSQQEANEVAIQENTAEFEQENVVESIEGKVDRLETECYVSGDGIYFENKLVAYVSDIGMRGEHNLINALLAISACKHFGVSDAAIRLGLKLFKPRAYRMTLTGEHAGKRYFNDSKGTNIDACLAAIRAMEGDTCLIVGGSDKGYEFDRLFLKLPKNIVKIYAVGETMHKILASAMRAGYTNIERATSIREATIAASKQNVRNVLLSPAAASFDSYQNYIERGKDFDNIVGEIMQIDSKKWTII